MAPDPERGRGRRPRLVAAWLLAVCIGFDAAADEIAIAIITAPESAQDEYSKPTLANIFRRRLLFGADGQPLVPVNLPLTHPLRVAFSRALFEVDPEEMEAYWNERYFHGISPPHVLGSTEAMLRFVADTPNAIGYVADCQVDDRVAVLRTLPITAPSPELLALCEPAGTSASRQQLQTKLAP